MLWKLCYELRIHSKTTTGAPLKFGNGELFGEELGLSRCDIKGARLWNNYLQTTSRYIKRASTSNFLNFLLASTSNMWDYNHILYS